VDVTSAAERLKTFSSDCFVGDLCLASFEASLRNTIGQKEREQAP
jgi:hypothetical protein